jgi:hypothetical protein
VRTAGHENGNRAVEAWSRLLHQAKALRELKALVQSSQKKKEALAQASPVAAGRSPRVESPLLAQTCKY